ncbi:3-deoxy-D-manno-octulosonic acid kinase [Catenovulum sediminis]|uniref:3-deoxy-D-manno-octulosonic acid kinase n=1 Tax=Catenovulum sediminis TaxID=1740262 RepID=A0ABV1RG17_9ALTE|nr:3-deoxy-D-manno-octulosonic acid kinase [Catenovulum sediminis]
MPQIQSITNSEHLILPAKTNLEVSSQWFSVEYWQQQNAIIGHSVGRNTTYFFRHKERNFVLRHYYRGGLIGKIARDGYFYLGLKKSRVYREFALLEKLSDLGLAVPKPIAARLKRKWPLYTADIIMQQISAAQDLFHILKKRPIEAEIWQNIGKTIAEFHLKGVYHADLNIHNIMLDEQGQTWLIDFDRGQIIDPKVSWQQNNLKRLLKSFHKEKGKYPSLHWHFSNWQTLLLAYQSEINRVLR